jgi:hypothetical protein
MFIFLLFAHQRLLGGECHHRQPDSLVDPVVDDERGAPDQIQSMALGNGGEGDAEKIVLGDHFTHVDYEHQMAAMVLELTCGNIVAGTSFDIVAVSTIKLRGAWTVRWVWVEEE